MDPPGAFSGGCQLKRNLFIVLAIFGVILLTTVLSACTTGALSIDVALTLYSGENWKIQIDLIYSRQEIQFIGPQIEQWLATSIAEWQAQGIRASYSQKVLDDSNVSYQITASGHGFTKLNVAFFNNLASISYDDATNQITFSYLPVGEFFSAALSRTFSLSGGKIIASNGAQEDSNTITWVNPVNVMNATLTPALQPGLIILVAIGAIIVIVLVIAIDRRAGKKRCYNCGARMPRRAEFCPECGVSWLPSME